MYQRRGSIKLIIGCMFAGKTTALINSIEKYHHAGRKCLIIKHNLDTRYDHLSNGGIVCNNGTEHNVVEIIIAESLQSVNVSQYDIIGVMESQFYDDLLVVDQWASDGKVIICDGLDADCNRNNFGKIHLLIPKCEEIVKLGAICRICGADAYFTKRTVASENIVEIGGKDKYIPVCRTCI